MCVRSEATPNVVHIHTFLHDLSASNPDITHLASIIFANPVKSAKWSQGDGESRRLVVAARTGAVYVWDGESGWLEDGEEASGGMMEGIGIPAREPGSHLSENQLTGSAGTVFAAHDVISAPDGCSIAILDKTQYCMLYETEGDETIGGKGWEASEGLSHVIEEEEDWEAGQASFLSSHPGGILT